MTLRYTIGGARYTREEVIHKYLHLVKYVAGRISGGLPMNVEMDDLIHDGVLGLIDAIEKYDDARGVKFETYAITRIHGAILDALRALDWAPRSVRQSARELERVYQDLEIEHGRAPTEDEMAARLGLTRKAYQRVLHRVHGAAVVSLEEPIPNSRGYELRVVDALKDEAIDVIGEIERHEDLGELRRAIAELPAKERLVIEMYYFESRSLKQIKREFNVSESRVSQIHTKAMLRLRQRLRDRAGDTAAPAAS